MNQYNFNTKKVVLDVEKLKEYLGEKYIDVLELIENTIDDVYECKFSEKKNKINIKRKASPKQKEASKANLGDPKIKNKNNDSQKDSKLCKINEDLKDEIAKLKSNFHMLQVENSILYKNESSQEKSNSEKIENSQEKNEDPQEYSLFPNSGFSVPMLDCNSIGDTSQGGDNELCTKCSSLLLNISKEYDEEVKSVKDIEELLTMSAFSNDVADSCEKYEKIIVALYEAQINKIRIVQSEVSQDQKIQAVSNLDSVFGKYGEVYEDLL